MSFSVFVQLNANGNQRKVINGLTKNTTISGLIQNIKDQELGQDAEIPSIIFRGKPLSDKNKTLGACHIKQGSMVLITFRMKGGMADGPRQFDIREAEDNDVVVSKNKCECKASGTEACTKNGVDRAEIKPCKHVYCSECAYMILNAGVNYNSASEIKCSISGCNKILDIDDLMFAGALDNGEMKQMEKQLNINSIGFECPNKNCQAALDGKGINVNKVKCTKCNGDWFCKVCRIKWPQNRKYTYTDCGNAECMSGPRLYQLLLNCDKKSNRADKNVPKMRLCIGCGSIDNWENACKHRTCNVCGSKYCHVCLKGDHSCKLNVACEIAPTQGVNN